MTQAIRYSCCRGVVVSIVVSASALLGGCGGGGGGDAESAPHAAPLSAAASLGEQIFRDRSLSASGQMSCSTCHEPAFGHSPANALPAQIGGVHGNRQGVRKTPSIRYLSANTAFFFDSEGTPTGGFFWDGRAESLAAQAAEPFLNPLEMANADKAAVVKRLVRARYAADFRALYGDKVFDDIDAAYRDMTLAMQQYEREDDEFHSYTSKYDAFLRGTAQLSNAERRGLVLFNSPTKGNCAGCHPSGRGEGGAMPLFTDFTYDNLGVPRNVKLKANADPTHFDLGLCQRTGLAGRTDLCGAFKVPTLRNVALRKAFFHNGRFTSLKEALQFYVQRDTNPEKWYPRKADGTVDKFNDLPAEYHRNVNTTEVPYNRKPGQAPALSDAEIDDVIVFLNTLTDGYQP